MRRCHHRLLSVPCPASLYSVTTVARRTCFRRRFVEDDRSSVDRSGQLMATLAAQVAMRTLQSEVSLLIVIKQ